VLQLVEDLLGTPGLSARQQLGRKGMDAHVIRGPPIRKGWLREPFEQAGSGGDMRDELAYIPLTTRGGPLPVLGRQAAEKREHGWIDLLQPHDHGIHPEKLSGAEMSAGSGSRLIGRLSSTDDRHSQADGT
jgi:hypothetical protein